MSSELATQYPIAGIAERYASALRSDLAARRDVGLDPCALATRLDQRLQAVHRDLHLTVTCRNPGTAAGPQRRSPIDVAQPLTDMPVFYVASTAGWVLTNDACEQVIAAMTLGAGARYVIVDLRDNPGGAGIIGNLIASYFYPLADGHVLVRGAFRDRSRDTLEGTYPYVPGPRLPDAKVYVIVNRQTASAAEGFAFGLQRAGRAKVVGQTTAGAGIAAWQKGFGGLIWASIPGKLILVPAVRPAGKASASNPILRPSPVASSTPSRF